MPAAVANPYANMELKIPSQHSEDFKKYTSRGKTEDGTNKDIDRSPFALYVDLWWTSICVGISVGRISSTENSEKFVTGVVLSQDPWRITYLELLAIAHTGSTNVIGKPSEVIGIANGFAATGVPILVDILIKKSEPIWDVSNYLKKLTVGQLAETFAISE